MDDKHQKFIYHLLVSSWLINALVTMPFGHPEPWLLNDGALHIHQVRMMNWAVEQGYPLYDFWNPVLNGGHPFSRTYPWLLHGILWLQQLVLTEVPLERLYEWTCWMLWMMFPLSIYKGARLLALSPNHAALAGAVAPWIQSNFRFGVEWATYDWLGPGLGPNLLGVVLFPLALGYGVQFISKGEKFAQALVWMMLTWFAHLMTGYCAAISLGFYSALVIFRLPVQRTPWMRMLVLALASLICLAPIMEPFLTQGTYINKTVWEPATYWDAYGLSETLKAFVSGELFDANRVGLLTALFFLGLLPTLHYKQASLWLICLGLFWFIAFCGRSSWNPASWFLPLDAKLAYERLLVQFQIIAVLIIGQTLSYMKARPGFLWILLLLVMMPSVSSSITRNWLEMPRVKQQTLASQQFVEHQFGKSLQQLRQSLKGQRLFVPPERDKHVQGMPFYQIPIQYDLPHIGNLWHTMAPISDKVYQIDLNNPEDAQAFALQLYLGPREQTPSKWQIIREGPSFVWARNPMAQSPINISASEATLDGWQPVLTPQFGYDLMLKATHASQVITTFSFHPHWSVTHDGKPISTFMTKDGFLSFEMPEGRHHVSLRYVSASHMGWFWLCSLGLIFLASILPKFQFSGFVGSKLKHF